MTANQLQDIVRKSDIFANTPDAIIEDDDNGNIDLNFFNTLNGF